MEPITIKSDLNLKTYYKISMKIIFTGKPIIAVFIFMIICLSWYVYNGVFEMDTTMMLIVWAALFFAILPLTTWFRCKANMTKFPVLAEGADIIVSENAIECVALSSASKSAWTTIQKGTEYDEYFVLLAKTKSIYYLPKNGFSSVDDIEKFKKIVGINNIKNNFK